MIPVPQTVEVRLQWTLGTAEQMVNVLHYFNIGEVSIDQDVADEVGNAIASAWALNLAEHASEEVLLQSIITKDISGDGFPAYVYEATEPGTATDTPLPYQLALCTTLRTNNGNRGGRGRVFLGGYTEAANEGGGFATSALRGATQTFFNAIDELAITSSDPNTTFVLGVTSRQAHVGNDPEGEPITPVTRAVVAKQTNRVWDTQRRRSNKLR